ncbi:molybdate ABC transporter substrate-binding protein [Parvibaculum sp.]|uniref:molybdate ABC transporter substrate-binding protein n=1 Tax=Parvibaculum sp. TaxID=2024848 RepID=UPI00320EA220
MGRRLFMSALLGCAVLVGTVSAGAAPARAGEPLVFAAASLKNVLDDIIKAYAETGGGKVVASYAGSSVLARQIEAGAKADIFISADTDWMDYLAKRGLIDGQSRSDLLGNRLVLIAPADSKVAITIGRNFPLRAALGDGRLAIADPESVPAGKYARAALTSLGVWGDVVDHTASAENVRVALAYVARGETPLGIVYETDAKQEPKVRIVGYFPEDTHLPIIYPAALTKGATPEAARFLEFLHGDKAKAAFLKAGFTALSQGAQQ